MYGKVLRCYFSATVLTLSILGKAISNVLSVIIKQQQQQLNTVLFFLAKVPVEF